MLNGLSSFAREEDAQATVEYTLLLSIVMLMFVVAIRKILLPAIQALGPTISNAFRERLFKKGAMHSLRISK
jgi:Flp pilus assembly pilin Flp